MSKTVIKIENLSKLYRIGEIGTGTISHDLNRWWKTKMLGQGDPYAQVGQVNDRTSQAEKGEHVWALKDINLEVKQGDILGVIGKNGTGKSTLLKLLSRVTSPTSGSIKVKGRLASLLEVGTGFHPEMTGRENIYMNGTIMGMRRWEIDQKLDEIVEFAGVAKYLDTPTKRYSSGMTVRLGFAIAAFLEPEILVVDEVLAVGDAEFQKKALGKMQDVSRGEGRTVLFVSHNMTSIQSLCTTCVHLKNGQNSLITTPDLCIQQYMLDSASLSNKDLSARTDRIGSQVLKFTTISVKNDKGSDPITGQDTIFVLNFHLKDVITNVVFQIKVFDQLGRLIFVCKNQFGKFKINRIDTSGQVEIRVKDTPLLHGAYYYNVRAMENGNVLDHVEHAGQFYVEQGDYFGIGRIPTSKPTMFIDQKWSLNMNKNS